MKLPHSAKIQQTRFAPAQLNFCWKKTGTPVLHLEHDTANAMLAPGIKVLINTTNFKNTKGFIVTCDSFDTVSDVKNRDTHDDAELYKTITYVTYIWYYILDFQKHPNMRLESTVYHITASMQCYGRKGIINTF
jgi:hypothetical protein